MNENILRRHMLDDGRSYEETEALLSEIAEQKNDEQRDREAEEKK